MSQELFDKHNTTDEPPKKCEGSGMVATGVDRRPGHIDYTNHTATCPMCKQVGIGLTRVFASCTCGKV